MVIFFMDMAIRSYKLIPTSVFAKSDLNTGVTTQQPKRSVRSIIENNLENTSFTPSTHHVAEQKIPQEGGGGCENPQNPICSSQC